MSRCCIIGCRLRTRTIVSSFSSCFSPITQHTVAAAGTSSGCGGGFGSRILLTHHEPIQPPTRKLSSLSLLWNHHRTLRLLLTSYDDRLFQSPIATTSTRRRRRRKRRFLSSAPPPSSSSLLSSLWCSRNNNTTGSTGNHHRVIQDSTSRHSHHYDSNRTHTLPIQRIIRPLQFSSSSSSSSLSSRSFGSPTTRTLTTNVHVHAHSQDGLGAKMMMKKETHSTHKLMTSPPPRTMMMTPTKLFTYLRLESFTVDEIESAFDRITTVEHKIETGTGTGTRVADGEVDSMNHTGSMNHDDHIHISTTTTPIVHNNNKNNILINQDNLQAFLVERIGEEPENHVFVDHHNHHHNNHHASEERHAFAHAEAIRILQLLLKDDENRRTNSSSLSKHAFVQRVQDLASQVDVRRSWPITASMLLVGSSVGILSPALPFLVSELALTPTQFGLTISAFALARMLGNVPSAIAVEKHGRKPFMTYSLVLVALATAGMGGVSSFEALYACRFVAGIGVAALATSATMIMTDISTPLNRASTLAPIMSAFAAGTAIGPAVGGYCVDQVGLRPTFYLVGLSFFGVALINRFVIEETKPPIIHTKNDTKNNNNNMQLQKDEEESAVSALKKAVGQWAPLMQQNIGVRNVMMMNLLYWVALAGSQMTLLPLILTAPDGLALSATQVGHAYMGMSLVQIIGNPVFGKAADTFGKTPAIIVGCSLISASMAGLTLCQDTTQLALTLGIWATGSSLLSTAPVAYVSDHVTTVQRAQALALLRTMGDIGFLGGAMTAGALADYTGSFATALQLGAAFLGTATLWFFMTSTTLPTTATTATTTRYDRQQHQQQKSSSSSQSHS